MSIPSSPVALPTTMTVPLQPDSRDLLQRVGIRLALYAILLAGFCTSHAGPLMSPGDMALRHDVRLLADYGVITGPVSGWPLAWGPVLADLSRVHDEIDLPVPVIDALSRVRNRGRWETRVDEVTFNAKAGIASEPNRIRPFQNSPREEAEVSLGLTWIGEFLSTDLNAQVVASAQDGETFRYDNSSLAVLLGNYAVTVNTLDRWWGPGWDGSLILSNNARPIPALTVERNFTDAFATKWLRWIGPWDLSVLFGQMEKERHIPDTRFFGIRFDMRPIPSLEIGLSRAAQWCGEGRPCGFDTVIDLLTGNDNRGGQGIDLENEPGNQLAGVDVRWSLAGFGWPAGIYGQFIGEDEAGGFPSRYLGLAGIDGSGIMGRQWSYRWFGELAYTKCNFHNSEDFFNCAYNHSIYRSGYRYRGRPVGHGGDNDALILSGGILLLDSDETQWQALLRFGELNRGGAPDIRNSLTATKQEMVSIDLIHSRIFAFGQVEFGAGFQQIDDAVSGTSARDGRAFLQWRTGY